MKDFQAGNCNHIVACFFSLKYPSAFPHRDVPTANIHWHSTGVRCKAFWGVACNIKVRNRCLARVHSRSNDPQTDAPSCFIRGCSAFYL